MNSLSFCENKYYTKTAKSIQFSESVPSFLESTMLHEEKVAGSTRTNQPVCLIIVRDFRPDAVDRL